jgi:hypothetical protein
MKPGLQVGFIKCIVLPFTNYDSIRAVQLWDNSAGRRALEDQVLPPNTHQTGVCWGIQVAGKKNRPFLLFKYTYQSLDSGQDRQPTGDKGMRALIQEEQLHIQDQQGALGWVEYLTAMSISERQKRFQQSFRFSTNTCIGIIFLFNHVNLRIYLLHHLDRAPNPGSVPCSSTWGEDR